MPNRSPSQEAVRLKVATGVLLGAMIGQAVFVPLAGGPLWASVFCGLCALGGMKLAHMVWALHRNSAPYLPILDSIVAYTRDIVPGHARIFDFVGAAVPVLCIPGRRATTKSFLRVDEEDLRALVDREEGDHVRVVADEITINGSVALQHLVVDSTDASDPLRSKPSGVLRRLGLAHANTKAGFLHPSAADLRELLDHLQSSDLVRDIKISSRGEE